jgi:hypothetical protein
VRAAPSQYWWAQPRFATRPPGQPPLYGQDSAASGTNTPDLALG